MFRLVSTPCSRSLSTKS